MQRMCWSLFLVVILCHRVIGQENSLAPYWPFDEASGTTVVEASKQTKDVIQGNFSFVSGVLGNGIKFDGFTTCITRDSIVDGVWNAPESKKP